MSPERLAELRALTRKRSGASHLDPDCRCEDCDIVRAIDELQSLKRDGYVLVPVENLESIRLFARDCIDTGHDRGALGNLYAIVDLCDALLSAAPTGAVP